MAHTSICRIAGGIPLPALGAALAFYDCYRYERLPVNLIPAQRDYFGTHTYERMAWRAATASTPTGPATPANRPPTTDRRLPAASTG